MGRTTRWKFSRHSFLLIGLATLVFAWGLQYKLSLDEGPHSVTRHMVEAKLLSGDDLGATAKGFAASLPTDIENLPPAATILVFFISLASFSLWGAWSRPVLRQERVAARLWRKPERVTHGAFFFRPPPSF